MSQYAEEERFAGPFEVVERQGLWASTTSEGVRMSFAGERGERT